MLDTLPTELLLRILRELRLLSPLQAFTPYYLISKKIHPIAQVAAYESLAISAVQFPAFTEFAKYVGSRLSGVLHLTLTLHNDCGMSHCAIPSNMNYKLSFGGGLRHDYSCSQHCIATPYEAKSRLPTRLSVDLKRLGATVEASMQKLHTFCLVIDNEPQDLRWCRCFGYPPHDLELAEILEALPVSCTSIKLDTGGCDLKKKSQNQGSGDTYRKAHSHLCVAVHNRLKHVKHLWLRVGRLCPWFFLENHTNMPASWLSASSGTIWSTHMNEVDIPPRTVYEYNEAKAWLQLPSHEKLFWERRYLADKASRQEPVDCPKFENLLTLIISTCVFPVTVGLETKTAAATAQNLCQAWNDWGCFPNLEVCHVTSQHSENLSYKDMLQLAQDQGLDPSFAPFTHFFVYDCNQRKTHVLPFSFLIPETQMGNYGIKDQRYHHIHDRYGTSCYGGFNYLSRMLDEQFSSPWRTLGSDGSEIALIEQAPEDAAKLRAEDQWLTQDEIVALVTEQVGHTYWLNRAEQLQNDCHHGFVTDIDIRNLKRNISGIGTE